MSFDKVFVLGAGAIGSIYGAFLSKRNNVTLIGNKSHTHVVNSRGLSIQGDINETSYPKADTEIRDIPEKTLLILTTKVYDSVKAVKKIEQLLRKDTIILILQNGLGNEEIVKQVVGEKARILRGITTMAAEFFEPGKIRFWNGETILEQNDDAEMIAQVFTGCALETKLSNDIHGEVWKKLVVNCVVNPLTAFFRVRNSEIIADSLRTVRCEVVRECVQVGKAEGVALSEGLEEEIDKELSKYANFSSMCQDVIKGKRTEIDFLNGKVVELGRRHHIPTPVNETLVSLIRFMEEKNGIPRED